jgi:HSP20 family protein
MTMLEPSKKIGAQNGGSYDLLSAIRSEMDQAFNRLEQGWVSLPRSWKFERDYLQPSLDVHENGKQVSIEMELPGVDEKDVTLSISNGKLVIKGQKKSERKETSDNCYLSERIFGSFERSLELPAGVDEDKIEATFEKGILKIVAPKRADAIKAEKQIPIKK